jgi:hypothetical protein
MMLLIVPVRVQNSQRMDPESVFWDFKIPASVKVLVVILVVVWPIVSDMPIYDDFLDMYMFCMLHDAWAAGVRGYTMQGNLFALLQAESEGITWKSYMWNLSHGVLKLFKDIVFNLMIHLNKICSFFSFSFNKTSTRI